MIIVTNKTITTIMIIITTIKAIVTTITTIIKTTCHTGLYLLYDSYVSAECKLGTLNALLHRALKICTNYNQFDVEVNKIRDKFNKLCYSKFIFYIYNILNILLRRKE